VLEVGNTLVGSGEQWLWWHATVNKCWGGADEASSLHGIFRSILCNDQQQQQQRQQKARAYYIHRSSYSQCMTGAWTSYSPTFAPLTSRSSTQWKRATCFRTFWDYSEGKDNNDKLCSARFPRI